MKYDREKMIQVFFSIWKKRPHVSEVSGKEIHGPLRTHYFHHILPSRKYPEAMYDEENIILLTADEHARVEQDKYRYEEINKRRKKLEKKYNI